MRAAIIGLLLVSSPAWACPFCSPTETDIFLEVQDAQSVVVASKVEAQKYKILEVLKGQATKGKVVLAAEPRGKNAPGATLVLTTAAPPTLPYWSDPPRYLSAAEYAFIKKALPLAQAPSAKKWDFATGYLENASPEIATAAYGLLAAAPLTEVQKRAKVVGTAKLLDWTRNARLPADRRALYLLMVYPSFVAKDAPWLKAALFDPKLSPMSPLLGPYIVAYLHATGPSGIAAVEKTFLAPGLPSTRTIAVTRALALLGHRSPSQPLKDAVRGVFLREVSNDGRGAFAIAPLAVWHDYRAAPAVEKLVAKNPNVTWMKVAAIRYFRSFSTPEASAALARLATSDSNLVSRTKDAYKTSDLGIE